MASLRNAALRRFYSELKVTMKVIDHLKETYLNTKTVLTIGAFDGVHLGHQALVRQVVRRAREAGCMSGVITFYPHPVNVLSPKHAVRYITTPGEKAVLFERLGVDFLVLLQFTPELARLSAREFMTMLVGHLQPMEIWVGHDFALGKSRQGNVNQLQELGGELGFEVFAMDPVTQNGQVVSSSRIRALLAAGEIEEVTGLLGRYYSISGEVVPGEKRGRRLGFPTANLEVRNEQALPIDGVYACFALLGADRFPAVANLGVRPTFGEEKHLLEVLLLDVNMDLYGCDLVVEIVKWLRPEQKFASAEALVTQMHQDVASARETLFAIGPRPYSLSSEASERVTGV